MKPVALVVFLMGTVGIALGADDPSGTWKWKQKFKFGDKETEVERSMTIKVEDGKVTGTITGGFGGGKGGKGSTKIDEGGTFKNGEISFTTTRVAGKDKDQKFVTTYKGKLDGDTIKGKIITKFGDKEQETDWEAKREVKKD